MKNIVMDGLTYLGLLFSTAAFFGLYTAELVTGEVFPIAAKITHVIWVFCAAWQVIVIREATDNIVPQCHQGGPQGDSVKGSQQGAAKDPLEGGV